MEDHVKQALEIVKAQAGVRNMTEEEINSMVKSIAQSLKEVTEAQPTEQKSEQASSPEEQTPHVDPKKAIKEKSIVCLECGKSFKILTKKHLASHDITPEQYKEKWGYKKKQSLVCKSLARERRKKMQEMQLWKKREKPQKPKIAAPEEEK